MGPFLPLHTLVVHKPHIGFVHQGCGLQAMAGPFPLHVAVSKPTEFGIDDGGKSLKRVLVSITPGAEKRACIVQIACHLQALHWWIIPPALKEEFFMAG